MAGKLAAPQQDDVDDMERIYAGVDENGDVEVMDLSSVDEAGTFTLIPIGTYDAEVVNVEYIKQNSKGNPMLTVTLAITEDGEYKDRRLRYYLVLRDPNAEKQANALARLRRFIARVAPGFDLSNFRPQEAAVDFAGARCRIKVVHQPYQDRKSANVADVLTPSEEEFI